MKLSRKLRFAAGSSSVARVVVGMAPSGPYTVRVTSACWPIRKRFDTRK